MGLISPPPHHDIYSIEDLSQLIYDLKNANRYARVSVKLVSETGVGTIAAGVSKGKADGVLISGARRRHRRLAAGLDQVRGLPWEIGLAETQQTLVLNDLRGRIRVQTDGGLKTGRDVVIAALLGADEFGFSTAPLVAMGCILMRVCHLNTCPVGIATQDPVLRERFAGEPEHVSSSYLLFTYRRGGARVHGEARVPHDRRDDRPGGSRSSKMRDGPIERTGRRSAGSTSTDLLHKPDVPHDDLPTPASAGSGARISTRCSTRSCSSWRRPRSSAARTRRDRPADPSNIDRTAGTILGSEVSLKYGDEGLPEDTITIASTGLAPGRAWAPSARRGITIDGRGRHQRLRGQGAVRRQGHRAGARGLELRPGENIITGNVVLYGATSGEAYFQGLAGERFCVRNSGANAVVEGVGEHGCEYMTGGNGGDPRHRPGATSARV